MKNCIYEPVFGLFLLFNFQIDSALTFSSRLNKKTTNYRLKKNRNMKEEIQKISINKTESNSGTNPSPTTFYF